MYLDTRTKEPRGTQLSSLYYKSFTIVIYDHNDSGQYYKITNDAKIVS